MKAFVSILLAGSFVCTAPRAFAQDSTSTADTLRQYVADLQKSPDDQELREKIREKIIKLALTLNPKPVVPDEAITASGLRRSVGSPRLGRACLGFSSRCNMLHPCST